MDMQRLFCNPLFLGVFTLLWSCGSVVAEERLSLTYQGVERSYLLEAPKGAEDPLALVIVLHGGGGNAENAVRMTGFADKAREEGFVAAFPEGSARIGNIRTWNAGHCCAYAADTQIDDIGFLNALMDDINTHIPIDPNRIYVTGMSNGAMMTHRAGIFLSRRIAAIAPVVGAVFGDEQMTKEPVSALIINGALDKNVPLQGGMGADEKRANPVKDAPYAPANAQVAFWLRADHCADILPTVEEQKIVTQLITGCAGGTEVQFVVVKDNGHAWPGGNKGSFFGDNPSRSYKATDEIWAFFRDHPKNSGQ